MDGARLNQGNNFRLIPIEEDEYFLTGIILFSIVVLLSFITGYQFIYFFLRYHIYLQRWALRGRDFGNK